MSLTSCQQPSNIQIASEVSRALLEDLGTSHDWTASLIDKDKLSTAIVTTNQEMIVCGKSWVEYAFLLCDCNCQFEWFVTEGQLVPATTRLLKITANSRSMLTAERSALNFLQTLSATATMTHKFVTQAANKNVKIMDTRKTIPGLRQAQKYAVSVGGGSNQRIGLFDGVLIKENHIIAHGGITQVLSYAKNYIPIDIPIQIEVESFVELKEALDAGAKLILLDNMSMLEIPQCVDYCKNYQVELEVSGNVNLENIHTYAQSGIHRISIGALTKNIQAIDLSMRFI
jgi:nicotinate-nucleotide pyrophosphorylase (carboxylating)